MICSWPRVPSKVERKLTELSAKQAALPLLEAYDISDLDVYTLTQI